MDLRQQSRARQHRGREWDKTTLLNFERETLGLYVSEHPLFGIEHIIARESDCSLADLTAEDAERPATDRAEAQIVKVGGILSGAPAQR
jgi:DNA polymerase III subunit alpha